ncbi:zinc finger CCCH domain-containing protein 3 [Caerostris darwini]|uniref:Zinc finger CCCH domain-containing protein 3 n=1 Tax=Caerostris darwini TaxID=1538125 RepID=A0AAV4NCB2_9ARAC|nr:zinc finger CCCH domain-containing protein 3 [Caerostris darwini]
MSSGNGSIKDRESLQRELKFYTNLLANHNKHLKTNVLYSNHQNIARKKFIQNTKTVTGFTYNKRPTSIGVSNHQNTMRNTFKTTTNFVYNKPSIQNTNVTHNFHWGLNNASTASRALPSVLKTPIQKSVSNLSPIIKSDLTRTSFKPPINHAKVTLRDASLKKKNDINFKKQCYLSKQNKLLKDIKTLEKKMKLVTNISTSVPKSKEVNKHSKCLMKIELPEKILKPLLDNDIKGKSNVNQNLTIKASLNDLGETTRTSKIKMDSISERSIEINQDKKYCNNRKAELKTEVVAPNFKILKKSPINKNWNKKWVNLNMRNKMHFKDKLNSKHKTFYKAKSIPKSPSVEQSGILKKRKLNTCISLSNYENLNKKTCMSWKSCHKKTYSNPLVLNRNRRQLFDSSSKKSDNHSFPPSSKYKVVNKPSILQNKLRKGKHFNKLPVSQRSSMDLDLLLELAAEKTESSHEGKTLTSLNKHVLVKRVFKSKNAIVNKNVCSVQTRAAKMIKTKYSILNKRNSWQKQEKSKKFKSYKFTKGHYMNTHFQQKMPSSYYQSNKRNYQKTIPPSIIQRKYPRNKFCFNSTHNNKIHKRYGIHKKVALKTPVAAKSTFPVSKILANRVLHHSINRALSATVKKKASSKTNTYCMFYNRFGRCSKGIKCPYIHDPSKIAVCTRFLRGTCKKENCPFSHEICPGKMAICSFFLSGVCARTDCPYRHEKLSPNATLCKAFVQGYCPLGKQCKQAHILVCPQFVQGCCEKGDACAFPHPPPKDKKNIIKPVEKKKCQEEAEPLIEKIDLEVYLSSPHS